MKTGKTFDCVQMKWDIQRKLREEEEGFLRMNGVP